MSKTKPQFNYQQIYQRLNITPETLANFCQKNQIIELLHKTDTTWYITSH